MYPVTSLSENGIFVFLFLPFFFYSLVLVRRLGQNSEGNKNVEKKFFLQVEFNELYKNLFFPVQQRCRK